MCIHTIFEVRAVTSRGSEAFKADTEINSLDANTGVRPILWLHVGVPRTGTTSLQNSFAANRSSLEEYGVRYVATSTSRVDANNLVRRLSKPKESQAGYIRRIRDQLAEFPSVTRRNYVLSSELFYNRGVARLFEAFDGFPGFETRILVYLRRQDFFQESLYCQLAKSRKVGTFGEYMADRKLGPDYAVLLSSLEGSGAKIVPRIYEKKDLIGGDTVSDFLHLLGLDRSRLNNPSPPRSRNASLPLRRLQLIQELLRAGLPVPARDALDQFGDTSGKVGSIAFLSKNERRDLLAHFEVSNETVRKRWFPDRETLFDLSDLADSAEEFDLSTGFSESELLEFSSMLKFLSTRLSP